MVHMSDQLIGLFGCCILKCALHLSKLGDKKAALNELKKANFMYPKHKLKIFEWFIRLGFKDYLDKLYINMNALTHYDYDDFLLIGV